MEIWQIAVLAACVVAAVLIWLLVRRSKTVDGRKKRVAGALKKFAALHNFKVLSDVTLPAAKDTTVHVDNILVGYFGVLLVNAEVAEADYYGEERDETWTIVQNEVKTRIPNPLRAGEAAMEAVRAIFVKNNVFNIQMEQLVVFTSPFRKHALYVKDSLPVVNLRRLNALLGKTRFEKDNGVDVDLMAGLIDGNRIK